jgi:uncharacterized ferritin-like protein (DUF455 family)
MAAQPEKIKAFAELVLYSPDLESKLLAPDSGLLDTKITSASPFLTPPLPARTPGLTLDRAKKPRENNFPTRSKLSEDRSRGLVLHFFANHELLALELMALALLKWPEAPEGFRRGLVQTMAEEQNHMRLYLGRMHDLGVEFGEANLNGFFWKCMKDLASPMEFAAAMSMTFEQANLDFALHYENLFQEEGDITSADIMKRVRLEEIGHVKHGVTWFERWRPKCERLFKEWQETLHFPMTPARAKGITFDREGRLAAGLPADFIDELYVHNQSKGRPPRVFWFNPGSEQEIEAGDLSWTPPKAIQALTSDYGSLMGLLGHKSDIVLVDEIPSVEFLKSLDDMGFEIPEFVRIRDMKTLNTRKILNFEPWGWSPAADEFFKPLKPYLLNPLEKHDRTPPTAKESIFSKGFAATIREKLSLDQISTLKPASVIEAATALIELRSKSPSSTVVFKAPLSASGRGMIRIKDDTLTEKDKSWISSVIGRHGFILAEPWLDKIVDLSAHIDINQDGAIKFIGITRFWTDLRGQYRGHILGRPFDDLGSEFLRLWHSENGWHDKLQKTAEQVGQEAFKAGYFGPMGIDAFIYRTEAEPELRPMIEINPRWSMGRVALKISQRLAAKHCGLWVHVSANDMKRAGHKSFPDLCQSLRAAQAEKIAENENSRLMHQGAFVLNDPGQARQSLAILIVGRDLSECYHILTRGGLHDEQLDIQSAASRGLHQSKN